MATITLTITQTVDSTTGNTQLDIESKPNGGLPGTMEKRVLDWAPVTLNHALLGNIRGRSRWCKLSDLDAPFLRDGWEEGTDEVIHFYTQHLDDKRLVTQQVMGFVVIDGVRHHARRVLVTKGEKERLEAKIVYNYIEPVDKK
ncbi:hypothetical protein N431DRAFT_430924 [Stipitochalara longipes BDJ]|nr:hypothetical protein N431DRAFT_430924 [Stipitochalara longipes BDJ]